MALAVDFVLLILAVAIRRSLLFSMHPSSDLNHPHPHISYSRLLRFDLYYSQCHSNLERLIVVSPYQVSELLIDSPLLFSSQMQAHSYSTFRQIPVTFHTPAHSL